MSFDHRAQVKNILGTVSVTIDDGFTLASMMVMYRGGPENLKPLFYVNDFDSVITIDRPRTQESAPDRRIQDVPQRYNADVPVYVSAIDKSTVTATKLLNKLRQAIETAVQNFAQHSTFTLSVNTGRGNNQPMAGYDPLWVDEYVFRYRPMES